MNQYPEVNANKPSMLRARRTSSSSATQQSTTLSQAQPERSSSYHSFPSPTTYPMAHRSDSTSSSGERIEAEYARYTDAPPPYSEKQYEGKSENEQNHMRMTDYSKEIARMMGRQLVRGLKIDDAEEGKEAKVAE